MSDDIAEITVASAPHVTTSTRVWRTTGPDVDVGCNSVGVGVAVVGVAVVGVVVVGEADVVISVLQVGALDRPWRGRLR
ncbi:hypothetical protein [Frankia sp. ACN1ag]|uniref:hypothetical protein n=1 Tax=Frankia sp. ACN1ag TaxID=102891 RepID=UPI00156B8F3F|nr:hypothetical protein [Frankia sp. ACN1ag]